MCHSALPVIVNKYYGIKILQDNGDLSCGFFLIYLYTFRRRGSSASAAEGSPNGGACHKRFTSHACSIAVCAVFTSPASRATRASGCSLCGFLFDLFFAKAIELNDLAPDRRFVRFRLRCGSRCR